jgi:hypothetical protein
VIYEYQIPIYSSDTHHLDRKQQLFFTIKLIQINRTSSTNPRQSDHHFQDIHMTIEEAILAALDQQAEMLA